MFDRDTNPRIDVRNVEEGDIAAKSDTTARKIACERVESKDTMTVVRAHIIEGDVDKSPNQVLLKEERVVREAILKDHILPIARRILSIQHVTFHRQTFQVHICKI